jgi:O-antigen/teichoic acid export membrane protein
VNSQTSAGKGVEWPGAGVPSPVVAGPSTAKPSAGLTLTGDRLRAWGRLSVLSLVDQGLTSGASFAVNLLLARWMAPDIYGAFAVAFAGFLFVSGFHNVLLIEPMTVNGPSSYAKRLPEYFGAQLRIHVILAGLLAVTCLVAAGLLFVSRLGGTLSGVILAAGLSVPFLLLLLLARRMCYVVQNPLIAVQASGAYALLLLGGTFGLRYLGWLSSISAFLWMACCSLLASIFILRRLGVSFGLGSSSGHVPLMQLLKENWGYGRWLTLTTGLSWISGQVQTVLAAGFLGLAGAGVLRAMQLPSLAMTQVVAATTLLVLPSMSQEMGRGNLSRMRKKAIVSAILLGATGILFAIGLFVFAAPLERLLFGGKYAAYARLIAALGLVPVFLGFSSSLSLALRILRKSHLELLAYILSAITALALALFLMPRWGLWGAAASIVGSTAVLAIAVLICFLKWGRQE